MKKHPTDEQIEEVSQLLDKYNRITKYDKLTSPSNWAYFFLNTDARTIELESERYKHTDPTYSKFLYLGALVFHRDVMESSLYKLMKEV